MRADGLARGVRIERRVVLSIMRAPVDLGADTGPFGSSDDLRRPPMFTVTTVDFLASPPLSTITSYTPALTPSLYGSRAGRGRLRAWAQPPPAMRRAAAASSSAWSNLGTLSAIEIALRQLETAKGAPVGAC